MEGTISCRCTLSGVLSPVASLSGTLSPRSSLTGTLTIPRTVMPNPYEGAYEVTPRAHDPVILSTRSKTMTDDVTVLKVPYYETSNIYDGKTVFIAEDIYNG